MQKITVETVVNVTPERAWELYTDPTHVVHWNNASPDWHTPRAENDLRVGGKFLSRMEARDASAGFDFNGTYNDVEVQKSIAYTIEDGRNVVVLFKDHGGKTAITVTFESENVNSPEMQREGWQAILDNFKRYSEDKK